MNLPAMHSSSAAAQVTPAVASSIEQILQTDWWHTMAVLHCPASQVELSHQQRPEAEPEAARNLRIAEWNLRVEKKCAQLSQVNPDKRYVMEPDSTGQKTLFEVIDGKNVACMWDGTTISTTGASKLNSAGIFTLDVYPIKYSEWTSCTNPNYGAEYLKAGQNLPYAGIGISVLMETTDGFIPLTRRGIETPVYPGALYSPGGGPKQGQSSVEAILEEILEETGLEAGKHFSRQDLVMLAYVSDTRHQGSDHGRPELVAYLPLRITARDICDVRDAYLEKKRIPEADVWAYEILRADQSNMRGMVVLRGNEMCPPTEAALSHLIHYKLLQKHSGDVQAAAVETSTFMDRVKSYGRETYHPPIARLAR